MNVSCLRSHVRQPTGSFLPYRHIRGAVAHCRSVPCFFGRFSRVFCHWRVVARHGNGDGLRLAHACSVSLSVAVYVSHVSILTHPAEVIEVAAWSERVAAVIVERQAAFGHIIQPTGSFLPYRQHPWPLAPYRSTVPRVFFGRFGRVFATGACCPSR
ncbi:hypothetical protein O9993_05660 [Vibrio lentus]|nr:hypothetical protein [Vibrio lentus]